MLRGMTLRRIILSVLAAGLVVVGAESKDERTAVQRAVTDYLDALYEAKPELIERSVHPNLSKHGFYRNKEGVYQKGVMTYTQLHTLAGKWNAGNNKRDLSKRIGASTTCNWSRRKTEPGRSSTSCGSPTRRRSSRVRLSCRSW
jgi:hypothetical protein